MVGPSGSLGVEAETFADPRNAERDVSKAVPAGWQGAVGDGPGLLLASVTLMYLRWFYITPQVFVRGCRGIQMDI